MQTMVNRLKTANRWVLIGAGVVVVGVVAAAASGAARPTPPVQARPQTVRATTGDLTGSVAISGQLVPRREVSLAMGASGIVQEVRVEQGERVQEGEVLVRLDDELARQSVDKASLALQLAEVKLSSAQHDYDNKVTWTPNQNQLNAAEANLANAQAAVQAAQADYDQVAWLPWVSSTQPSLVLQQATNNFNRAKADLDYLYSNSPDTLFARDNLQAARLGLSSAQIDLQMAKDTLDKLTLTAPFDGTVTAVHVDVGEAAAGPVVEMATMDHLEVVLDVDEVDVGQLKVGQSAAVTFEAWPGSQVTGKVINIAPKANATANVVNFEVRIALDPTELELRAGLTANAVIQTFSVKDALLLPRDAVAVDRQTGKATVSLMTAGGPTITEVTLGRRSDQSVQILSGLADGDEVLAVAP